MLYVIIGVIAMCMLLDKAARRGRLSKLKLKTRFQLFSLRDELRWSLIKGEVQPNRWFEYMDTTLTKSIDNLEDINLLESVALVALYHRNQEVHEAVAKLKEALAQPSNRQLALISEKYTECLTHFLIARHFGTVRSGLFLLKVADKLNALNRGLVNIFASAPETSTLLMYSR
jgi:hypothetical protein